MGMDRDSSWTRRLSTVRRSWSPARPSEPARAASRRAWGLLALAAAAVGAGIATRHVWLQVFPPEIPACGAPFAFMRETMDTPGLIQQVLIGTGDCGKIDWTFLGLSMPWWSLIWFLLLAAWAVYAGFARRR